MQLQHAWQGEGLEGQDSPEYAPLKGRLCMEKLGKGAVSDTYKTPNNMPDTLTKLREDGPGTQERWRTLTGRRR